MLSPEGPALPLQRFEHQLSPERRLRNPDSRPLFHIVRERFRAPNATSGNGDIPVARNVMDSTINAAYPSLAKRNENNMTDPVTEPQSDLWDLTQDFLVHAYYDGTPIRFNPAADVLLGGRLPIAEDDAGATQAALDAMRVSGKPIRLSAPLETSEGEQRYISWSIVPNPSGESFFAIGHDTTEIVNTRKRLREVEERLAQMQRMETLGQLAGGVAHDFNNLLVPILNVLDLLERRPQVDPDFNELIKGAHRAAISARTMVRRMLSFARQNQTEPTLADISPLLKEMKELLVHILPPTVHVEIEAESSLRPIRLHANQLELSLLNLAINASHAMPNGGDLRIQARGTNNGVEISVADNGTGMDAETVERATEAFFTTKDSSKGTGLGLFMANRLAQQSGGRLEIQSKPDEGTTIKLHFPAADGDEEAPGQT